MRPRILILSTAYLPHIGGSELAIHHIAQRATDFDFDMVTSRLSDADAVSETVGRIRVFRAGGRWARATIILPKLLMPLAIAMSALRLMRSHRYAAVHAYQASQAGGAGLLVKLLRPRVPFIVTLQEGKELDRQSWLTRMGRAMILRRADAVTAISGYLAAYARRFSHAPVHLIPNGVDIASMHLPDIPREPHLVLTVSRLVEKNNVANLIRAMSIIRAAVPDAKLAIIGSGKLREELEELAADQQLAGVVVFVGALPHEQLAPWLVQAGVFARPSLSEGLGSAFLEAMAARTPVVASAVGGIPDIVRHEETGLICNPQDPQDIARTIIRLVTDAQLRERIVATADEMVRKTHDWNMIAQRMQEVYPRYA